jgi:hypothetical protein
MSQCLSFITLVEPSQPLLIENTPLRIQHLVWGGPRTLQHRAAAVSPPAAPTWSWTAAWAAAAAAAASAAGLTTYPQMPSLLRSFCPQLLCKELHHHLWKLRLQLHLQRPSRGCQSLQGR